MVIAPRVVIEVVMIKTVMIKSVMIEVVMIVIMMVEVVKIAEVVISEISVCRIAVCVCAGILIVARCCYAAGQENERAEQERDRRGRRQAIDPATSDAAGRLSVCNHDRLSLQNAD
jgi:hypothetical protein